MTFRQRMKTSVSNAELDLRIELEQRGVQQSRLFNYQLVLQSCCPDIVFPDDRLCVFIDGHPHRKQSRMDRDSVIDSTLKRRGWRVLRERYKGTLSKKRLGEIADSVEACLK